MRGLNFEYYVVNYDFNKKSVVMYNIFDNVHVYDDTLKAVVKHFTMSINYEEFLKELENAIRHEMWARREYEISVSDAFDENIDNYKKYDAWYQAKPNIEVIARSVISTAKEFFFDEDTVSRWDKPYGARAPIYVDELKERVYYSVEDAKEDITDEDVKETESFGKEGYYLRFIKEYIEK